ncbi:MAG: twin-arginine translocation signal domain-containing protein [Spirochaetes bacterium]|nr:twin-arginine translocation signal domain-containing protein [Spirochaetota bacterium]
MTRRKFIKTCFAAAGLAALGSCSKRIWAGGGQEQNVSRKYRPGYLALAESGELERREQELWKKMESCSLCPRMCGVNRMAGEMAVCNSDHTLRVASSGVAFNAERAIVGHRGKGSIFMSNCNLLCIFCQNWHINHRGDGNTTTHAELAAMMLDLQRRRAHNVGIVTPTHVVPHIVTALRLAIDQGLNIPLVFSTGGYETLEVVQLLDGIVDVYVSSFKFQDSEISAPFQQGAPDYPGYAAAAIKEMHRQVGTLNIVDGVANRGLLIRHLVLPENLAGTDVFVRWVVDELGADTDVSIMSQYRPAFRAHNHPPLDRRITPGEFERAMRWARQAGLRNFH